MITFPKSTEFNKRIPKETFYTNLSMNTSLKRVFIDEVKNIYWKNKIAPSTVSISQGTDVLEIEIFVIELKEKNYSAEILKQIDKAIPYHIIYALKFEDKIQYAAGYKEVTSNGSSKVVKYYSTQWMNDSDISINLIGLNTDRTYENIIRLIAGDSIEFKSESLSEDILKSNERQKLQKEIDKLTRQAKNEKQPNKKFELMQRINKLKGEL